VCACVCACVRACAQREEHWPSACFVEERATNLATIPAGSKEVNPETFLTADFTNHRLQRSTYAFSNETLRSAIKASTEGK
jgi:hypothetical protein